MKVKNCISIVLLLSAFLLMALNDPPDEMEQKYGLLNKLIKNYSNQTIFCLDPGEEFLFTRQDQSKYIIKLLTVKDHKDKVVNRMRKSVVGIEINGKPVQLICEPYSMPREMYGIRIMADSTSGWENIYKRVQFSVWDAKDPLLKDTDFVFPIKDYLLYSHETQSHNQVVHLGYKDGEPENGVMVYHDYGMDFALYTGKNEIVCPVDGTILGLWQPEGKTCSVTVKDKFGLIWDIVHFIDVDPGIKAGVVIKKGQKIGTIGRNSCMSSNSSNLHVGIYLSDHYLSKGDLGTPQLNLYPWMVYFYQRQYKKDLYAVARPHQVLLTNEKVMIDASHCISFDKPITSYTWVLPDGNIVKKDTAELTFKKPGVYMAELWIRDAQGNEDVDFCKIKVYTRGNIQKLIPTIFMCCTPTLNLKPRQDITFQFWIQAENEKKIPLTVDFGDGTIISNYISYTEMKHSFSMPGIYVVTASALYKGMPVTQKQKVVVSL